MIRIGRIAMFFKFAESLGVIFYPYRDRIASTRSAGYSVNQNDDMEGPGSATVK